MIRFKIEMDRGVASVKGLADAPIDIKRKVSKELVAVGRDIASSARSMATPHPHGLYRGGARPGYSTRKKSLLSVGVYATDKGAAITEFAAKGETASGKALVEGLNKYYEKKGGAGGGRVMWAAYDAKEDAYRKAVEDIVANAAAELQRKVD